MPPKSSTKTSSSLSNEESEHDSHVKLWLPEFQHLALFVSSLGNRVEIDIDGRKTDLYTVEGFNSRGMKYVVQVWGVDAFAVEEYFK